MTRFMYSKEANRQPNLDVESAAAGEAGQILHLKRLLVTLKQHYEKSLHSSQIQLQAEQNQRIALQKEVDKMQLQLLEREKFHEEEAESLRSQQACLKELLKKTQEELKSFRDQYPDDSMSKCQTEELSNQLNKSQKRIEDLELELAENKQRAQREIERMRSLLETQRQNNQIEAVVSTTSSHHLKQELEALKGALIPETKALEARYVEILNEKIGLELQCKQLQHQLEHQSANLTNFQMHMHQMEEHKKVFEEILRTKEAELTENSEKQQELLLRIQELDERVREKDFVQDKYEQLKDEWNQLGDRLEEAVETRAQAERYLAELETLAAKQAADLKDFGQQLQSLQEEKKNLESERDQLKILLDESEARLKVAQQHLAKKVKESALLNEKVEEQLISLADLTQALDQQKTQNAQLQASADLFQKQEKRLQEQLHDALKGTESQVAKWEEKYFRMYDKWQESENKISELKKFEEKHHQMQHLLANLGNFMGGSFNPVAAPAASAGVTPPWAAAGIAAAPNAAGQEAAERNPRPFELDAPLDEEPPALPANETDEDERYDLFGMRQPQDKYKPKHFS